MFGGYTKRPPADLIQSLWLFNIAMENDRVIYLSKAKVVMFHRCVKLPKRIHEITVNQDPSTHYTPIHKTSPCKKNIKTSIKHHFLTAHTTDTTTPIDTLHSFNTLQPENSWRPDRSKLQGGHEASIVGQGLGCRTNGDFVKDLHFLIGFRKKYK